MLAKLSGVLRAEARAAIAGASRQPGVRIAGQPCTLRLPLVLGLLAPCSQPVGNVWWQCPRERGAGDELGLGGPALPSEGAPLGPRQPPCCCVRMETRGDGYQSLTWRGRVQGPLLEASHYMEKHFLVFN